MEKYSISLDWFEAYCFLYDDAFLAGFEGVTERDIYRIERAPGGGGRTFKYHYVVYLKNRQVASFVCVPYSKVIKPRACLIKLHNRVLYSQIWFAEFERLIRALRLEYRGISRLDLAYDCNYFKYHRSPQKFIKQYVTAEPDSLEYIHRKGSNNFGLRGRKRRERDILLNYITWGAEKSRVRCYIYDKTLELREIKEKPWIREVWTHAGIEHEKRSDGTFPQVWRSEISISCQGFDILNYDTGELFRLRPDYLCTQDKLESLFYIYAEKCFSFSQKGIHKRVRDYRPIQLFEKSNKLTMRPYFASTSAESGRTEKVCINLLQKIAYTYTDVVEHYNASIADTIELLNTIISNKALKYKELRNEYAISHMGASERLFNKRFRGFGQMDEVFRLAAEIPKPILDAVLAPDEKSLYEQIQKSPDEVNDILARLYG